MSRLILQKGKKMKIEIDIGSLHDELDNIVDHTFKGEPITHQQFIVLQHTLATLSALYDGGTKTVDIELPFSWETPS